MTGEEDPRALRAALQGMGGGMGGGGAPGGRMLGASQAPMGGGMRPSGGMGAPARGGVAGGGGQAMMGRGGALAGPGAPRQMYSQTPRPAPVRLGPQAGMGPQGMGRLQSAAQSAARMPAPSPALRGRGSPPYQGLGTGRRVPIPGRSPYGGPIGMQVGMGNAGAMGVNFAPDTRDYGAVGHGSGYGQPATAYQAGLQGGTIGAGRGSVGAILPGDPRHAGAPPIREAVLPEEMARMTPLERDAMIRRRRLEAEAQRGR